MQFSSKNFWENHYQNKLTSGAGSYGLLAKIKAEVINNFIINNSINTVVEFGCGDGNQLSKFNCPNYIGYDVSETVIEICKEKFKNDPSKKFYLYDQYRGEKYNLSLSLDVIFHLIEEDVFEKYMNTLFNSSNEYVIIYSSNGDSELINTPKHVLDRNFTDWVSKNYPDFSLINKILNPRKYTLKENDKINTSISDFYIYKKIS